MEELSAIITRLEKAVLPLHSPLTRQGLVAAEKSIRQAESAWSGSWLGYHARVYYEELRDPPPTAKFSRDWGLLFGEGVLGEPSKGNWHKYRREDVVSTIWQNAGKPNLLTVRQASILAAKTFEAAKSQLVGMLDELLEPHGGDAILIGLSSKIAEARLMDKSDFIDEWTPNGLPPTQDEFALAEGLQVPPHLTVKAEICAVRHPFMLCEELARITRLLVKRLDELTGRETVLSAPPTTPAHSPTAAPAPSSAHRAPPAPGNPPATPARPVAGTAGQAATSRPQAASTAPLRSSNAAPKPAGQPAPKQAAPPATHAAPKPALQSSAPPPHPQPQKPGSPPLQGTQPGPAAQALPPAQPAPAAQPASEVPTNQATPQRQPAPKPAICIGHGRSAQWKILRDHVQTHLMLPWTQLSRVPVAGLSMVARLAETFRKSNFAILILTMEDIETEGAREAELNLVHTAGLFQGRLGIGRAVVLIEEDCGDLGHLHDLPQIRYPQANIAAAFAELRVLLEQEKVIPV